MNTNQGQQDTDVMDGVLMQAAERLFAAEALKDSTQHRQSEFATEAWEALTDAGLHLALLPEDAGGFGVAPRDALILLRIAGEHLVNLPLAETMLASWLLAAARIPIPEGPLTAGPVISPDSLTLTRSSDQWHVQGHLHRIPWAQHAKAMAAIANHDDVPFVVLVSNSDWQLTPGTNVAEEPRDTLIIDTQLADAAVAPAPAGIGAAEFRSAGAAMRSLQLAGAMIRVRDMSIQFAQERSQFGRPLAKFQVLQHNLAIIAAQTAAAVAASDIAAEAVDTTVRIEAVAVAKARTSEAAASIASLAHQLHGAMGFTDEHKLHHATKRLWSWREEFGNEFEWQRLLGRIATQNGPDRFWPEITNF